MVLDEVGSPPWQDGHNKTILNIFCGWEIAPVDFKKCECHI